MSSLYCKLFVETTISYDCRISLHTDLYESSQKGINDAVASVISCSS